MNKKMILSVMLTVQTSTMLSIPNTTDDGRVSRIKRAIALQLDQLKTNAHDSWTKLTGFNVHRAITTAPKPVTLTALTTVLLLTTYIALGKNTGALIISENHLVDEDRQLPSNEELDQLLKAYPAIAKPYVKQIRQLQDQRTSLLSDHQVLQDGLAANEKELATNRQQQSNVGMQFYGAIRSSSKIHKKRPSCPEEWSNS